MKTDIEIAQEARMLPIGEVARYIFRFVFRKDCKKPRWKACVSNGNQSDSGR